MSKAKTPCPHEIVGKAIPVQQPKHKKGLGLETKAFACGI